nr:ATPase [uncultured bacterium]
MNIKEAKEQIKIAMSAYLARDEWGNYEIPRSGQRPVFLLGAPGIGKTQIIEQIAAELDVPLVSYSMTHHTRQSALGLPFLASRTYQGQPMQVSEYTMSEILSSVYDIMEATGREEGILFLDEINCVSETLTPSMLQFLQFKTFGRHALPEGWLVVTAGNPPEYNRTVREFDIVTLDRLKKIEVEPDFEAWKEYAYRADIHPAILSYLQVKKDHFYHVETKVSGKSFVTARGWEDLSRMIRLCEKKELPVDRKLIGQYLQDEKISRDFSAYYDLFRKYRSDYQVEAILAGTWSEEIEERARAARFDEKIALLGLLLHSLSDRCQAIASEEDSLLLILEVLQKVKERGGEGEGTGEGKREGEEKEELRKGTESLQEKIAQKEKKGTLALTEKRTIQRAHAFLSSLAREAEGFEDCRKAYKKETDSLQEKAQETRQSLGQAFAFLEKVYPQGQEMLLFVTELTVDEATARFLTHYGCESYDRHSRELLFQERRKDLSERAKRFLA